MSDQGAGTNKEIETTERIFGKFSLGEAPEGCGVTTGTMQTLQEVTRQTQNSYAKFRQFQATRVFPVSSPVEAVRREYFGLYAPGHNASDKPCVRWALDARSELQTTDVASVAGVCVWNGSACRGSADNGGVVPWEQPRFWAMCPVHGTPVKHVRAIRLLIS